MRKNRRILVGVTGGIAAYKSPDLVRRLAERGADVRVVMTEAACEFITPLTLQAVSGHPVHRHLLDTDAESGMGHIELARWAELIVIAPATANFIARMVGGKADDLLATLVLASGAEIAVAPAMNLQMWQNEATRKNLDRLRERGVRVIGPAEGGQACGETGPGRMSEPDQIAQELLGDATPKLLADAHVVLTAGPTWEAIDPVRGITNHSSGKMGFALAEAARDFGARVTLVSGPVHLEAPAGVTRIDVISARDMLEAVEAHVGDADLFIGVAAVSDYRPVRSEGSKIKKNDEKMELGLVRNPDILRTVAAMDNPPFTVGFAAETDRIDENAKSKLEDKRIDMIVANDVGGEDGAFGNDHNRATVHHPGGAIPLERHDKYGLSVRILEIAASLWRGESAGLTADPDAS
ncbi:MAG: bifunctional phosphopantothenoylcysteine decarboxylase/phosphopantothenate--cysteine ligase CoaBC [Gammaproteobacteria bacterium]|nr:bifunctional phosphopantothenoylcysteine decarboxylase/phosphopantothenate--cysteine ligase CoaBC [Gammaproteobacteria bacterium]MYD75105.1 bifunctional phosphopantothenoylcysteine decarboxylase/phosphopantothenate--cysteine ligase CoaBC [Gammaproteobacteria bacterium]MYJ52300.1 bifunctional phosphopantothenoylcysteine decarboxylase/phosphopantothenate--cysteine ligase CoaBC [Gammaproteobacteria bacterium]